MSESMLRVRMSCFPLIIPLNVSEQSRVRCLMLSVCSNCANCALWGNLLTEPSRNMPQDPGMLISILLPNTLQRINVRAKRWCLTGDNIILIHPFLPNLTIASIFSKLQLLRCGSSGLMKGCALRGGQINPHGAAKVQDSPVAPGNTTSSRNAVWTKCCGRPTLTHVQQACFCREIEKLRFPSSRALRVELSL